MLDLDLRLENGQFHFYDPRAQQLLLNHRETEQARQEANRARQEAERVAAREVALRQAAEARLAELEARLRGLGGI